MQAVDDAAYCPRCFTDQGRKLRHALVDCFRSIKTEAAVVTGKRNTLLWMWNAFAVICVGFMLMLVPLLNSVVHVQLSARVVVGLDTVLLIISRPRADPLTRRAGYVVMVTRLGWQSYCTGLDAVSPLF